MITELSLSLLVLEEASEGGVRRGEMGVGDAEDFGSERGGEDPELLRLIPIRFRTFKLRSWLVGSGVDELNSVSETRSVSITLYTVSLSESIKFVGRGPARLMCNAERRALCELSLL
jgi:hypothetical protein